MNRKKYKYYLLLILLVIFLTLLFVVRFKNRETLDVVFLDVGQGDSILISQGSRQILVDGGKDGKILLEKIGKYVPFWDRTIETVIVSHPDQDHIGGLVKLFQAYKVESIIQTKYMSDSQTYKKLDELIDANNVEEIEAVKDVVIKFLERGELRVIYPSISLGEKSLESNASSVVAVVEFGKNSFLLTGDLPGEQEKDLIEKGVLKTEIDILKVSHHGSKYSTSSEFLDVIKPKDAIISAGKNNTYGHPNQEVIKRLEDKRVNVLRTDQKGDVVYECPNVEIACLLMN